MKLWIILDSWDIQHLLWYNNHSPEPRSPGGTEKPQRAAIKGLFAMRQNWLDSTENIAQGFVGLLEKQRKKSIHFHSPTRAIYKIFLQTYHLYGKYTKESYNSTLVEYKTRKNKLNIQISR